jgi:3-oxoacyl-[acyl-carrier-protein] synthase II
MMISSMAAAQVAITLGIKGPNFSVASACASGAHGIGEAAEIIKRGDARVMLAGGASAGITPIAVAALNAIRAISTRNDEPERASRPFDADRDGFVLGEGAAVMVLEDAEHALQRGAPILAELVGYGATADAAHISAPDVEGVAATHAMRRALQKARLKPKQVDYVNAHGTSTRLNDPQETKIIKTALGDAAYSIPVSSIKSMLGHLMSAAGAVEAVVSVKTIIEGIIPPTINLENPDPECDLDYVPNVARKADVEIALTNSFGLGGQNGVLIFRKWSEAS